MFKKIILFFFISSVLYAFDEENPYMRKYNNGQNRKYKLEYSGNWRPTKPKDDSDNEESSGYDNKLPLPNGNYKGVYKVGKPYEVLGQTYYPKEDEDYEEVGMASHYGDGDGFHGQKTANGETYNMNDYTAAHRTLPLPSVVRVMNLENGKSINVRVNDRGPFAKGRIIDVSNKVAKELNFHNKGTTKVKVVYLKKESDELLKKLGLRR